MDRVSVKGLALGVAVPWALSMLFAGWVAPYGDATSWVKLFADIYIGYGPGFIGGIIGGIEAFFDGLVLGAIAAWVYNWTITWKKTAHKRYKAQSAMEYLMTYGWAILIIAVVLGALFQLGVFNGGSLAGSSCVASPGFYCQNLALQNAATTTNGITLTFGQSLGYTIYNLAMACAATSNSLGYPSGTTFNDINSVGSWMPSLGVVGTSLASGSTIAIGVTATSNNIPCIGSNGKSVGFGSAVGTPFSGYLWLNYTTNSGAPAAGTNPWYTIKVATISTKVV